MSVKSYLKREPEIFKAIQLTENNKFEVEKFLKKECPKDVDLISFIHQDENIGCYIASIKGRTRIFDQLNFKRKYKELT